MSYFFMPELLRMWRCQGAFWKVMCCAWAFVFIAVDVSLIVVLIYSVSAK